MAKDDDDEKGASAEKKGGKGKLIMMVLPTLLLLVGAGWFFFLRGDPAAAATPEPLPPPVPGPVLKMDPITINLAGGHFLKLGIALQTSADAHEVDGSQALDLAISKFSGMSLEELASSDGREKAKEELLEEIKHAYLPHEEHLKQQEAAQAAGTPTGEASSEESHSKAESSPEESGSHSESESESESESSGEKTPEPALTVNPMVYDVYFTEFVMQ